jgi:hypothetical protein
MKNIIQLTFGQGLIRISKARKESDNHESIIVLSKLESPREIGAIGDCPYVGKEVTAIPEPRVELWFDNIAGLDSLLLSLNEIRTQMSKEEEK